MKVGPEDSLSSEASVLARLDHTRVYLPAYLMPSASTFPMWRQLPGNTLASLISNHLPSTTTRLTIVDDKLHSSVAAADIDGALIILMQKELPYLTTLDLNELWPPGIWIRGLPRTFHYAKQHDIVVMMPKTAQETVKSGQPPTSRSAFVNLVCS